MDEKMIFPKHNSSAILMPRINGYEATRNIRKLDNKSKSQIPVLAMTANAFEEDKQEAIRSGMNGHLE